LSGGVIGFSFRLPRVTSSFAFVRLLRCDEFRGVSSMSAERTRAAKWV